MDRGLPTSGSRSLILLVLVFVAFSGAYALLSPPFENPDEVDHARYVTFLADFRRLPSFSEDCIRLAAFHPPLYHLALAPLATLNGTTYETLFFGYRLNRDPARPLVLLSHGFADERFPYAASPRFIHAARLLTIIPGVIAIVFIWKLAGALLPDESLRALATAIAAMLPQFQYLSGSVNHDSLVAAAGCALLYYSVRLAKEPRFANAAGAAIALLVGLLTKSSMLALAPIPLLAIASAWWNGHARLACVAAAACVLVLPATGAGWWYYDNWRVFGTPLPTTMLVQHTWVGDGIRRESPFTGDDYVSLATTVFRSLVFLGGLMNVAPPAAVYAVWAPVFALAALGVVVLGRDLAGRFVSVAVVLMVGGLVAFNSSVSSPQGRYLFPVLGGLAASVAAAFGLLVPPPRRRLAVGALVLVLSVASLATLASFGGVYPAIAPRSREAETAATARLFCGADYRQLLPSEGQPIEGLRLYVRGLGPGHYDLDVSVFVRGQAEPLQTIRIPGAELPQDDFGAVDVHFAPVVTASDSVILSLRAPRAKPSDRPLVRYRWCESPDGLEKPKDKHPGALLTVDGVELPAVVTSQVFTGQNPRGASELRCPREASGALRAPSLLRPPT